MALGQHLRNAFSCQSDHRHGTTSLTINSSSYRCPSGIEMAATLADLLLVRKLRQFARDSVVILNRSKEILKSQYHLREIAQKALQQRTVPVEMLLEVSASAIRPSQVEYKHHNQLETPSSNHYLDSWKYSSSTTKDLPISQEDRDRQERIWVTPMQLPNFSEVLPVVTAAKKTQQLPRWPISGGSDRRNLQAIAEGKTLSQHM